jgi:glucose-1-phosphate thymidylyltransferase
MKTVILAAGYATRLYPLTQNKPKALLSIGSKPLLDHLADKIAAIRGPNEVVLVTNDRFARLFEEWAQKSKLPARPRVLNDGTTSNDDRLGAVGDLDFAIRKAGLADDLLVLASDNLFDGSLADFAAFARAKTGAGVGVYDLKDPALGAGRYGMVTLDGTSRITAIDEKPERPRTRFASMGVYYFPAPSLGLIREYLASPDKKDAPGHYAAWLLAKMPVYGYVFTGRWYDIGSIDQLEEAGREFERAPA